MTSPSPTGRRSDRTRGKILKAARERFAAYGFERTTVRAVALDATIDPSMVMRYFGSKEGLFAAAATFELALPNLASLPQEEVGTALVRHFLQRWEGREEDDLLRVLIRAAASNADAVARMQDIVRSQVAVALSDIAPAGEAAFRSGLIASQILGLAYCRYILELPELNVPSEALARAVGPTLQRYVFEPVDC